MPSTASRKADAYSNLGSLMGMERFAKRHRKTLNELLVTHVSSRHRIPRFACCCTQLDVEGFEGLLQQWMALQLGVADGVDTLVCVTNGFRKAVGKTLRGSIAETASGEARFIA